MDRKLIIRNFGAIKSASICLKDYNIFIGEQGSGKSTIAKLITIFEGYTINRIGDFQQNLLSLFEEHNIASYFNEYTSVGKAVPYIMNIIDSLVKFQNPKKYLL